MEWWLFKCRIKCRLNKTQRKALSGELPMTESLFWECLYVFYSRFEMDKYHALWSKYPAYVKKWQEKFEAEYADPNSELHKREDPHWNTPQAKLTDILGDEWVRENIEKR